MADIDFTDGAAAVSGGFCACRSRGDCQAEPSVMDGRAQAVEVRRGGLRERLWIPERVAERLYCSV